MLKKNPVAGRHPAIESGAGRDFGLPPLPIPIIHRPHVFLDLKAGSKPLGELASCLKRSMLLEASSAPELALSSMLMILFHAWLIHDLRQFLIAHSCPQKHQSASRNQQRDGLIRILFQSGSFLNIYQARA